VMSNAALFTSAPATWSRRPCSGAPSKREMRFVVRRERLIGAPKLRERLTLTNERVADFLAIAKVISVSEPRDYCLAVSDSCARSCVRKALRKAASASTSGLNLDTNSSGLRLAAIFSRIATARTFSAREFRPV
jgi:hypothetical protein